MEWINIKDNEDIIINELVLITDGNDVVPGFIDSNLEWRFISQDICDHNDFEVTHYMHFPDPPEEI